MRIKGSVVVVTGASSGIGRATVQALAARGAHTVLVARDAESLADAAAQCALHGAETLVVAADVSDADAVEDAARRAVDRFGRIDAWVNAAAVTMYGAFTDVPLADFRRVLDVTMMGPVHGCRAALPRMIEQGRGVVVNVSSILGVIAQPYGSAYSMSKFAVRGLGVSLREELRLAGIRGVDVCTVLPAAIDTPIFDNAANHCGRRARAIPPVYTPERVARIIVNRIRVPRREVVAGGLLGRAFLLQHKVLPGVAERILAEDVDRWGLSRTETAPDSTGNLYRPAPGPGRVHGGWHGHRRERRRRGVALAAAAVAAAAAAVRR
jgi:NAD(P)-dependent dehydrogenase (short-subunit alcohol dehydrogenase family)